MWEGSKQQGNNGGKAVIINKVPTGLLPIRTRMAMPPRKTSRIEIFFLKNKGSKNAVKKPDPDIQTTAIETLPYFTLP